MTKYFPPFEWTPEELEEIRLRFHPTKEEKKAKVRAKRYAKQKRWAENRLKELPMPNTGVRFIPLVQNCPLAEPFAIVDEEDYERLIVHRWVGHVPPPQKKTKPQCTIGQESVFMSRFIMGVEDPEIDVHHKDRNTVNNRKHNLQVMTKREHIELHRREGYKVKLGVTY